MARINGKEVNLNGVNLLSYLEKEGFNRDRIAVEFNGEIIKRDSYSDYVINQEDSVEIVCFVGGG